MLRACEIFAEQAQFIRQYEVLEHMQRLFVYGTLMRGQDNAHWLKPARYLCSLRTTAGFQLVNLGPYPGMVAQATGTVAGEVFAVPDGLLPKLDAFEEHPHVYVRSLVHLQNGTVCHAYVLRPELARGKAVVPGGDWRLCQPSKRTIDLRV
jgi:gamma-glutamylaminecyclotransferase